MFTGIYCPDCGQHHGTKRLVARELWDNIAFSFVNFDRGIPNTLKKLFSHPGKMIKEYISGHRVVFSHPMALLLLLCTIYGIIVGVAHASVPLEDVSELVGDVEKSSSESGWLGAILYLLERIKDSTIFIAVLPIPVFAWATRRLFRRYDSHKYNFAELLFMGLYMACQRMVVSIVLEPFIIIFPEAEIFSILKGALYVVLAAWCFREIFGIKWVRSLWKGLRMFIVGWLALAGVVALFVISVLIIAALVALIGNLI